MEALLPLMLFSRERPIRHMEIARGLDSVMTLRDVVIRLRAVPERRKAIVYVSLGVPLDPSRAFADPSDPTARMDVSLAPSPLSDSRPRRHGGRAPHGPSQPV
jgi:hypothetical protein